MTHTPRFSPRLAAGLLLLLACVSLAGCDWIAAGMSAAGPDPVPPKYKLPSKPTLILVENFEHSGLQADGDAVADAVYEVLKEEKAAPLIDLAVLQRLRGQDPQKYTNMNMVDIGKAVGAGQIIYVDLQQCDVDSVAGSDAIQGTLTAKVHVVDVATGQTRWPTDSVDYPIHHQTSFTTPTAAENGPNSRTGVERDLVEQGALKISRLFITYKPEFNNAAEEKDREFQQ